MDNLNNIYGKSFNYKGILLYPIKMENVMNFYENVDCLLINKNEIKDVDIIRMSYFEFLLEYNCHQPELKLITKLRNLFELVLLNKSFEICKDKNGSFCFTIGEKLFYANDFDAIKKIIFNQNLIRYTDEILSEEFKEALKETEAFLSAKNEPATIEERIISYHCETGITYDDIEKLTIYQFNKGLERLNLIESFRIYTYPAIKSGEGDKIPHWLSHIPEKGVYDDITMSMDELSKTTGDSDIFASS